MNSTAPPRRPSTPHRDQRLPLGPLADWIDGHPDGPALLAIRAGLTADKVALIARRHRHTVLLQDADRLLAANDAHLRDVWPDIDDLLPLPTSGTKQEVPA